MEEIKFEPMKTVGQIQTTNIILSKMYGVPRPKNNLELSSEVVSKLSDDRPLPFLCRLCATRGKDMVNMFGNNKLHKNITEKIKDCGLPIVVKKTDNLPKYACRICLGKLELCYQFHKTVAEAEQQLLTYNGDKKSSKIEEAEECRPTFPVYNGQRSARNLASNGKILKPLTEICRTDDLCKSSRTRNASDECKKSDLSTSLMNSSQNSEFHVKQSDTLNNSMIKKHLRSEKDEQKPDSDFYSPPITRSQSQTVCNRQKKKETRKLTSDDDILFWEKKFKEQRPKLNDSMKTTNLEKELRPEKEKEICNSEFYSLPITRSQSHTVSDSMKKTEARNDSSDDDHFFWEEKSVNQSPKLNDPINTMNLGKELGSEKEEDMSDSKFPSPPITKSRKPRVCDSPKKVEFSKDNSDDDILFWEEKFKDQIFPDQSVDFDGITCRICEATFQTVEKCYLHASVHAWINYYPCCLCDKTFKTEMNWKKHGLEHIEIDEFQNRETMHDCNECGKKFVSEARLKFHKLFHKTSAEIIPTTKVAPSLQQLCWNLNQRLLAEARKDPLDGHRKQHKCKECDTVTDSEKSLQEHILISHKKHEEFCCNVCGDQFRTEEQLNDHQRNHNRGFECNLGKRRFDSTDELQGHKESPCRPLSTENKFETCTRKGHLIIHLISHTRERPYSCTICSKKFVTKAVRNNHCRKHTGERSFHCSECEKTFVWAESFKQHEAFHSENLFWKCTRCNGSCKTSRSGYNQLNLHSKRSYKCDLCGSRFEEQRVLRRREKAKQGKIDRMK